MLRIKFYLQWQRFSCFLTQSQRLHCLLETGQTWLKQGRASHIAQAGQTRLKQVIGLFCDVFPTMVKVLSVAEHRGYILCVCCKDRSGAYPDMTFALTRMASYFF